MWRSCFWFSSSTVIRMAATIREIRVGMATPSAPQPKPYTRMAFPHTLMMFISMDTFMDTWELPMERKMAAPALYRAMKGMEAFTISR